LERCYRREGIWEHGVAFSCVIDGLAEIRSFFFFLDYVGLIFFIFLIWDDWVSNRRQRGGKYYNTCSLSGLVGVRLCNFW